MDRRLILSRVRLGQLVLPALLELLGRSALLGPLVPSVPLGRPARLG